ncbi:hypothetical protein BS639_23335 [Rouxiella silvae]|uniref:N-acetyltransferase n=1 Tax=Rouxiella silvae TaxID=1646373 RepID=A0ABX3TUB9_9GAMM|nr:hypothetical protein [Rouxiella silvae]ORJ18825.1 hypothetical protein BS639_23335 [Rouxiella silvae]
MKCRHAKDSELDGVCSLLAEEFYNDAIHKLIFSDHAVRMDGLRNLFRIYVNLATRHGGILLDENGAGALVYFCPEAMKMNDEDIASVDHQLRQVCGSNYPAAAVYTNGLDQHHPRTPPHYYISLLAVQRVHRGGTVVGDLLNALNSMLDKDNLPCYAECTRFSTRTLLRRWGYRDAGSPLHIDGFPKLFPIWREPRGITGVN